MKSLFAIATLFCHLLVFSQSATLFLDTHKIRIGEQIKMQLTFDYENPRGNAVVLWPIYDDLLTDGIEIVSKSIDKDELIDSSKALYRRQQRFILTSFEEGTYSIPPQEIELGDSTYLTDSALILVETVPVDTSKGVYDIKPIYAVDYPITERSKDWFLENWYWIAIILGLIIAFLVYRYVQQRKKQEGPAEAKVIIPAHILAMEKLDQLLKEEAWKSEQKKNYYSELTDTVRSYLENRFDIHAMEKTTREIIQDLKYSPISEADKVYLRKILREADMVKFAKFSPTHEDALVYLHNSIDFVNRTKTEEKSNHEN